MRTLHRVIRRVTTVATAALLALGMGIAGASSAPTYAAENATHGATSGLTDFGACMAGSGHGSFLFLMDQSGSLRTTDPGKARVTASHYLADRLASYAASAGVDLDIRVAGFAADYQPAGEWTTLSGSSASSSVAAIKDTLTRVGDNIMDVDTDYWNALDGALQDLRDHDSSGCRAIAWLSDGDFDLDVRTSAATREEFGTEKPYAPGISLTDEGGVAAAEDAGIEDLCRPTGVADQVRAAGITVVGVGLSDGSADFSLMQRVTKAVGGDYEGLPRCGDQTTPVGAFYPVADLDSLLMAFDAIGAAGTSVDERLVEICQGSVCTRGEMSFVLDGSLDGAHILATSSVDDLDAYLYRPGSGDPLVLPSSESEERAEMGVHSRWITPHTLVITAFAADSTAWDGVWRLAFIDRGASSEGQRARINLKLSSPSQLVWEGLDDVNFRAGETLDGVMINLYDRPDGHVVDPARITGGISASITLDDAQGNHTELFSTETATDFGAPHAITIPADLAAGSATLTRSVTLTTPDATTTDGVTVPGTVLSPTVVTQTVDLLPPLNFPTVGTALAFPLMEKETTAYAKLGVTGPGCVWLDPQSVQFSGVPAGAGTMSISSEHDSAATCLEVAEGASAELTLDVTGEKVGNGAISGTLNVKIAPLGTADEARDVTVTFSGEMRRPLNVATTSIAFVVALILGIAIPLVLLYLVKYVTARIPKGPLFVASTTVLLPEDGSAPEIALEMQQFAHMSVLKAAKSVNAAGYQLRAHAGLAPTSVPYVRLESPQALSISSARVGERGGRAVLPLSVRGTWVAVCDEPDAPTHVTLVVLSASNDVRVTDAIVADARQHLSGRVQRLMAKTAKGTGGAQGAVSGESAAGASSSVPAAPGADLPLPTPSSNTSVFLAPPSAGQGPAVPPPSAGSPVASPPMPGSGPAMPPPAPSA